MAKNLSQARKAINLPSKHLPDNEQSPVYFDWLTAKRRPALFHLSLFVTKLEVSYFPQILASSLEFMRARGTAICVLLREYFMQERRLYDV